MDQDHQAIKSALRDRMLSLEVAELTTAKEHYEQFIADAKLDDLEQHDNAEIAEARENADLAAAFDHPVKDHSAKIEALKALDFSVTDRVQPGAVVGFGGRHVVVAVSTTQFDHNGVRYMGISPLSPVFKAMEGLEVGDSFVFNGKEVRIDEVF